MRVLIRWVSSLDREEPLEVKDWNELFEKLKEIYDEWIFFLNPEEEDFPGYEDIDVVAYVYDGYFD